MKRVATIVCLAGGIVTVLGIALAGRHQRSALAAILGGCAAMWLAVAVMAT